MKYLGVPRRVIRGAFLFYALYPLVPLFGEAMAKDSLFSCFWVLFLMAYIEVVRARGRVLGSGRFCLFLGLVLVLLFLTKKTGVYIAVPALIALLFAVRAHSSRLIACAAVSCLLFFGLWESVLLPAWGVEKGEQAELLSVPSQQVSYLLRTHGDGLRDQDIQVIESAYGSARQLADGYNPLRADATKVLWRNDAPAGDKLRFALWYLEQGVRHPLTYLKAFLALDLPAYHSYFGSAEGYNGVTHPITSALLLSPGASTVDIDLVSIHYDIDKGATTAMTSGYHRPTLLARASQAFDGLYEQVQQLFAPFFCKALFILWGPLLIVFYAWRTRRRVALWVMVPLGLMIASLLVGPILLTRYMIALVYALPLAVLVLFVRDGIDCGDAHESAREPVAAGDA